MSAEPRYQEVPAWMARLENGETVPDLLAGHLELRRVATHPKGIIAEARYRDKTQYSNLPSVSPHMRHVGVYENPDGHDYKIFAYYPTASDASFFAESARFMISRKKGPLARIFPGALGVIHAHTVKLGSVQGRRWTIDQLHGCFLKSKEAGIGYARWKPHRLWKEALLEHFFTQAAEDGARQVLLRLKHWVADGKGGRMEVEVGPGNAAAFKKIAARHGFEPLEPMEGDPYVAVARRKNQSEMETGAH